MHSNDFISFTTVAFCNNKKREPTWRPPDRLSLFGTAIDSLKGEEKAQLIRTIDLQVDRRGRSGQSYQELSAPQSKQSR